MMDVATLILGLASASAAERAAAAERLAQLGSEARSAAVVLARASGDADETVREWATSALEELGPPPADQVPQLADLLSAEPPVAYWAATLLGRAESVGERAVAQLIAALDEGADPAVRQRAAWALGQRGAEAASAVPALQRAADGSDARLARLASKALEQVRS